MKTLLKALLVPLLVVTTFAVEAPASVTPVSKTPVKEKVYELPKTGQNLARAKGGWINVGIVGTRLVVKFYDKKKKPASPDVVRGFARFNYAVKNDKTAVLNLEGDTLVTPATVRPPHNFLVILSLFAGDSAEVSESFTFKYP